MPTPDQLANVTAQVEALKESRYEAFSAVAARPCFVNAPDDAPSWDTLNEEQRLYVLASHVNWTGFTREQELDAMQVALGNIDPDLIADAERVLHDVRESYQCDEYREDFPAASDIRMHLTGEFPGPTWDDLDRDRKEMLLGKALGIDRPAYQLIDGFASHEAKRMIGEFLDAERPEYRMDSIEPDSSRQPDTSARPKISTIEERRALASYEEHCREQGTAENDQERTQYVEGWLGAAEEHRMAGVEAYYEDLGLERPETDESEPMLTPDDTQRLFREWRDDESQRPLRDKGVHYEDVPTLEQSKPAETSEPGEYKIYHTTDPLAGFRASMSGGEMPEFPEGYDLVGVVRARDMDHAFELTNNTETAWEDKPGVVQSRIDRDRSTSVGDVIVDPQDQAYRIGRTGYERLESAYDRYLDQMAARGSNRDRGGPER